MAHAGWMPGAIPAKVFVESETSFYKIIAYKNNTAAMKS